MALALGAVNHGALQQIILYRSFVRLIWFVVFEVFRQILRMVEDLLYRPWHSESLEELRPGRHCVNYELDVFGWCDSNLKKPSRPVGADEHDEVIELEDSNRISISVQHVVISDPMPMGCY
ncbi:MAG: hypothetical protein ACLFWH_04595 [Actinomycetota bacterium]